MIYTLDDGQLLRIWTVSRFLGEIRNIPDPTIRSEVLTEAQVLLTAFILTLKSLPRDQGDAIRPGTRLDEMRGFDA
jgi:hypothetical protein